MIPFRQIEVTVVEALQAWLLEKGYSCPVIKANQTAPIPTYPYISYSVITPVGSDMKGYSIAEDGTRYKPLTQTWSFTAQSGDDIEAMTVAMLAYDWFALTGHTLLTDNGIVPQRVRNITARDNLLSIEYEYRKGFDVELLLMNTLDEADCTSAGFIETATLKPEMEG